MKKIFFLLILITSIAFAGKEVRTCMFDNDGQYFADGKLSCFEPNLPDNITMKSLYKDGWELKTSYFPWITGGTKYSETHVSVVLVFERTLPSRSK